MPERTMTLSLALRTTATALAQMSNVLLQMSETPAAVPAAAPVQEVWSHFTPKTAPKKVKVVTDEDYARSIKWNQKMKTITLEMWNHVLPNGEHVHSQREIAKELSIPLALVKFYCGPVFKRGRKPITEQTRQSIVNLRAGGLTFDAIGKATGVHLSTAAKYSYHVSKRINILDPQDEATIARLVVKVAKSNPALV